MSRPSTGDWIRAAAEVTDADRPLVGGKAANLARLGRCGQRVPPWFVVTTAAFRCALSEAGIDPAGLNAGEEGGVESASETGAGTVAESLRRRIRAMEPPAALAAAILDAHAAAFGSGARVAVRSSAVGEDAAGASFAGLYDSFLHVRGGDELLAAVRGVWASAFNERALAYRRSRGLPLDGVAVAVVVQQMVEASRSGVMFTANPNTGDVHQVVVSALYGAGEGLVSAGLDADTWVVDKDDRGEVGEVTRREVADKRRRMVFDRAEGAGLVTEPVPDEDRERPCLDDGELREVVEAGLAVERTFRCPQDVEFSFDRQGRLVLLQTRPVTTVEEDGPAAGNRQVWDNSNIIESYSGVTSPLTFSFIRHAYTIVYHCFAEVMGIDREVVRRNRTTFENMLGLFRGQVYYNLRNWYRLIHLFPGFDYNREFMESMMGVRESLDFGDSEPSRPGFWRRTFVELPALLRLIARSVWNFLRIRRIVARFETRFREHHGRWSALDVDTLAPHEILQLYREMEEELLWHWKAPIINDFFVMVFYGTLKRLCTAWCGDDTGSLQNDLVCGEGGIESTEPTRRLLDLARRARLDPELERFLREGPPAEVAARLPAETRFRDFYAEVLDYLDRYGFRSMDELKLEEPSLSERPDFLYQVIANYLAMGDRMQDPEEAARRERRIRREAEERAFARLGPVRRWVFRRVLANARLGIKNRENMRFARTRVYGLLRELLRALARSWVREGLLDAEPDIFYLTLDEVWSFIQGTAVTLDLRALVELRRRELEGYREDEEAMPDDRFETWGMACHRNRFKARRRATEEGSKEGGLQGTGCCPGVVTGPVKVLRTPAEDARLAGEILVAERTDPGWVPLYPAASGLLIERGSILSHSAIVAREMGLPTIVGIPGLTAVLDSGRWVRMDGSAGTVEVLETGDRAAPD